MKRSISLFLIFSLMLISFTFALDVPENIEVPENVSDEMIEELYDQYFLPGQFESEYCLLIEPYTQEIIGQEIPKQVPFTTEVFSLYLAEEPVASLFIEDKVIKDLICGSVSEDTTYNIYISSLDLISEVDENTNPIDFYKEKRKSGEIQIKAVGFGRSIKLFFLNIGIDIASWFM